MALDFLQVQNSILDLLGTALVPILGADIAAGTAGDVHLRLIGIAAVRADPDELAFLVLFNLNFSVVAADLAIVALGVQLGIHDVVVDEADDTEDGFEVVLHIGNLDIGDRTAGRERLELRFKRELGERVDLFRDVDMVAVGDIGLIVDALDDAEALLQALGELIRRGFQRRAVEGEVDIVLRLPLLARVVHVLHDGQCKRRCGRVGMALAGHELDTFIKTCVAEGDRRIAAVEELIDRLALLQSCQRSVLPEDRCRIGQRTLEAVVTAHQRLVAQLQTLVKDLPELVDIAAGGKCNVRQVDCDNALIEAAVILRLAVFIDIRR